MAWRQIMSFHRKSLSIPSNLVPWFASFSSKPNHYIVKVGIPEFLNGVGKGVETHVQKLETEIGDFQKLLVTRTLKLKKLGIPCKHVINFISSDSLFISCILFHSRRMRQFFYVIYSWLNSCFW
ncbi:hypothetical protein F0562_029205 [Nyssa sinensis]|uniref:Small ribosomal subunit protein mS41 SAM domain-containing protein n=1 Tax=Nyssa sinensis TaxID=561372 RepID=A0A5J5B4I2_9ASTE|nr:hypothetical protein F0562_029205 [Nyssa sinensis]